MSDVFLDSADLAYLADAVGGFVAFGIGFGAVLWLLGLGIYVVYLLVRY